MKTVSFIAMVLLCYSATSCKPATSEVIIEMVDTAYISKLPSVADTVIAVNPSADAKLLGAASAMVYNIGGGQKQLILSFDPLGNVVAMQERRNGKLIDSAAFHPNGQRLFALTLSAEGVADGPAKFFYSDGRVRQDGRYLNGQKIGIWRLFNESGKLQETHEYSQSGEQLK